MGGSRMTEYYFDIETEDRDPAKNRVIAVAYQPIRSDRPGGDLGILKGWELGEASLLKRVLKLGVFEAEPARAFEFIPVGVNLAFDYNFLITRMRKTGVRRWTLSQALEVFHSKPMKDMKTALVMMNDGSFVGSGLDRFTRKKRSAGHVMLRLWAERNYQGIEKYIRGEAAGFFEVYGQVTAILRDMGRRMRVKP